MYTNISIYMIYVIIISRLESTFRFKIHHIFTACLTHTLLWILFLATEPRHYKVCVGIPQWVLLLERNLIPVGDTQPNAKEVRGSREKNSNNWQVCPLCETVYKGTKWISLFSIVTDAEMNKPFDAVLFN